MHAISWAQIMWCLVFLWKKGSGDMGGMGAFGPPLVGGPAPTYPLKQEKNGKNQPFLAFYIFAPPPPPHNPHPHPNINLSVPFLEFPASIFVVCG